MAESTLLDSSSPNTRFKRPEPTLDYEKDVKVQASGLGLVGWGLYGPAGQPEGPDQDTISSF